MTDENTQDGGAGGGGGGQGGAQGGGQQASWYEPLGFDEGQRAFIAGKGYQSAGDLVKSAMDFERIARERNVIPKPDADPAKRLEWEGWKELGWNPDRAQYKVDPVTVPDGKSYDAKIEQAFLDAAHSARVPASQAKAILDAVAKYGFDAQEAERARGAQSLQETEGALKTEWGANFEANKAAAVQAAKFMGIGAEDASALEKITGAPGLLKFFAKLGGMLAEDTLKGGGGGAGGGGGMTPDGARAERQRLASDPQWIKALSDPSHPNHKATAARNRELIELMRPGRK